jgi:NhaC family Na+:H+ antiporter
MKAGKYIMRLEDAKLKLSLPEAIGVLAILFLIIATGIIHYGLAPHIPILAAILFLFVYGTKKAAIYDYGSGYSQGQFHRSIYISFH